MLAQSVNHVTLDIVMPPTNVKNVLFPEPEAPVTATDSPVCISMLQFLSARTALSPTP